MARPSAYRRGSHGDISSGAAAITGRARGGKAGAGEAINLGLLDRPDWDPGPGAREGPSPRSVCRGRGIRLQPSGGIIPGKREPKPLTHVFTATPVQLPIAVAGSRGFKSTD